MPTCAECNTPISADADACPSCGHAVAETHVCPNCGEEFADDEACPACGTLLSASRCDRHPDREARAQCVICGTTLCAECDNQSGRAHVCAEHASVPVVEGWAQIYSTSTDIQAELIAENLQAEGIDARILSQKDHFAFPVDLGDLSPVRVLVPAYAYQDAERTIAAHMDEHRDVSFACPECGEQYEAGVEICPNCGANLR